MKDAGQIRKYLLEQGITNDVNVAVKENGAVIEFRDVDDATKAQCEQLMKGYVEPGEKADYELKRAAEYPPSPERLEAIIEQLTALVPPENRTEKFAALVDKVIAVQTKYPATSRQ